MADNSGDEERNEDNDMLTKDKRRLGDLIDENEIEQEGNDFNELRNECDNDQYTSILCKEVLSKVRDQFSPSFGYMKVDFWYLQ